MLRHSSNSQSFELVLFRLRLCRAKLTVLAPRCFTLLAGTKDPGTQTIQSTPDML